MDPSEPRLLSSCLWVYHLTTDPSPLPRSWLLLTQLPEIYELVIVPGPQSWAFSLSQGLDAFVFQVYHNPPGCEAQSFPYRFTLSDFFVWNKVSYLRLTSNRSSCFTSWVLVLQMCSNTSVFVVVVFKTRFPVSQIALNSWTFVSLCLAYPLIFFEIGSGKIISFSSWNQVLGHMG